MTEKQKNFISVVIYVHNSEDIIENFLKGIYKIFSQNFETFEIICVDDSSTDKSREKIEKIATGLKGCMVSIINMSYYQGLETSMHAGIDLAIGDFVFEFDSAVIDYDTALIMQIYNRSLEGFDIVSCGAENRRIISKIFYSIYNRNSGVSYNLKSETFRIISRRAINRVHSMSENFPYRKAFYSGCGLKTDFIQYEPFNPGYSIKRNLKDPQDTALTSLMLFTDVVYKITLTLTSLMMVATLLAIVYIVIIYFKGSPVAGYTTMMLMMSGGFFGVFAIMTLIIKYLSIILKTVFNKQKYVIEDIEKLTN